MVRNSVEYTGVQRIESNGFYWLHGVVTELQNGHAQTSHQLLLPKTPLTLLELEERVARRADQNTALRRDTSNSWGQRDHFHNAHDYQVAINGLERIAFERDHIPLLDTHPRDYHPAMRPEHQTLTALMALQVESLMEYIPPEGWEPWFSAADVQKAIACYEFCYGRKCDTVVRNDRIPVFLLDGTRGVDVGSGDQALIRRQTEWQNWMVRLRDLMRFEPSYDIPHPYTVINDFQISPPGFCEYVRQVSDEIAWMQESQELHSIWQEREELLHQHRSAERADGVYV